MLALRLPQIVPIEVVKFLIFQGANVNAKNNEDETAMTLAQNRGNKEIVTLLSSPEQLTKLIKAQTTVEKTFDKKATFNKFKESKPFLYSEIDFGRYYALAIGNNNYQNLPQLISAKNDAQEVAKILKNLYGCGYRLSLIKLSPNLSKQYHGTLPITITHRNNI